VNGETVAAVEKDGSEGAGARVGTGLGTFSSLSIRNFRFLLTGTVLSNAGQWIQQVTMSWLVYDITGSGVMLGTINLVRSLAAISMLPIAGVLIDRSSRRMIMLAVNGWIFAITLTLGILLLVGQAHVGMLFVFAFLGGLAQTVDGTLRQVMVFDLVPRSGAPNAVALIQTGWSLMRSFGPGIGGFLIIWVGAGGNFLVQAGACVLIALTIVQISFPKRNTEGVRASPLQNIKEGIRYVAGQKTTRTFMLMGFILPLFIIPIFGILPPIYAKDVFHGDAGTLGLLLSSIGVGGIAGGVVVASLGRVQRRGLIQLAALFLMSVTLIGFAFSKTLWMALALLAVSGFFEMLFLTTNQTLLQLSIPDNLRGRVTAVVNLNAVLSPLGGLMAGAGSDLLGGPRAITVVLASVGAVIALAVFAWSPTVREYRLGREPSAQQA
jgi:MFS transporter, DHA1 family, staphyloferrin A biosynthesis exporter